MKKPIWTLAITTLFVVITLGGCICFSAPRLPKEAELIQNFNAHRAAFEQLRDMLEADTNLSRVASWGVETRKPFFLGYPLEKDFPNARFKKYLALLKEAKALGGVRGEGQYSDPSILVWAWGWAGNTEHIEICWLDEPPTNQVPALGDYLAYSTNSIGVYKHIDQNWYFWSDGLIPATR